ncbi:MAG: hypothetical protein HC780_12525 [Leptolyngbyaceae cyanobacterium CSU_1_3]|nr:hypothetical protein [Leptolyngbyaceae cyanobacterium CSU_1_3]
MSFKILPKAVLVKLAETHITTKVVKQAIDPLLIFSSRNHDVYLGTYGKLLKYFVAYIHQQAAEVERRSAPH